MAFISQRVIGERDIGLHGRGMVLVVVSIAFNIIGLCLVITRAASRLTIGRSLGKDDYTIIVSMVGFSMIVTVGRSSSSFILA